MNHYYTSQDDRVSKSIIDSRCRKAKEAKLSQQFEDYGYNYCEDCGRSSGVYLDCSHNISVDWCQKNRCVELVWDLDNITIRCRECHQKLDKLNLIFNE